MYKTVIVQLQSSHQICVCFIQDFLSAPHADQHRSLGRNTHLTTKWTLKIVQLLGKCKRGHKIAHFRLCEVVQIYSIRKKNLIKLNLDVLKLVRLPLFIYSYFSSLWKYIPTYSTSTLVLAANIESVQSQTKHILISFINICSRSQIKKVVQFGIREF